MVVPAFAGLGAPWWDPYARGTILGISRATTKYHVIRATLESMAYQTCDVLELMEEEIGTSIEALRVDGGASANNFLLSFQADVSGKKIIRPECIETTALGAAALAGLAVGFFASTDYISKCIGINKRFEPVIDADERRLRMSNWKKAVSKTLDWIDKN
jgi:glycerol kinase